MFGWHYRRLIEVLDVLIDIEVGDNWDSLCSILVPSTRTRYPNGCSLRLACVSAATSLLNELWLLGWRLTEIGIHQATIHLRDSSSLLEWHVLVLELHQ